MTYSFSFIGNEAAPGYTDHITLIGDLTKPGDQLLWSIPSYSKVMASGKVVTTGSNLDEVVPDGGSWVGHVTVLPGGILNTTATYYPPQDGSQKRDAIQFCGPIDKAHMIDTEVTCLLPVVGGTGKYAGARGESQVRIVTSNQGTLLFVYDVDITLPISKA